MIFTYSDYIYEKHEFNRIGKVGKVKEIKYELPKNYKLFFRNRGICPSCKTACQIVYQKSKSFTLSLNFYSTIDIWECENCGWWESLEKFTEEKDGIDEVWRLQNETLNYAILKSFKASDKSLPISALLQELERNNSVLYEIDPYKMEKLVQHVFSAFYNCEVKHVGKTGDGGKDLIIVLSDEPILVQVKRRGKNESVEQISTVRDFLGTMFIENSRKGIIVSTADHFSRPSKTTTKKLLSENRLDVFELVDFKRFCEMLDIINYKGKKGWDKLVETWEK